MSEKQKLIAIYLPKDPETGLVTSEQMSSVDDGDDSGYESRRKDFITNNFGREVLYTIHFHEALGGDEPGKHLTIVDNGVDNQGRPNYEIVDISSKDFGTRLNPDKTAKLLDYMGGYTSIDDYLKENTPTKKSSEDTESVSDSGDSFESLDGATNDIYIHPESMKTILRGIDELIIDVRVIEENLNAGDVEVKDIEGLLTRWCAIFGHDDTGSQPGGLMGKINTIPEIQKLPKFQKAVEVQKRVSADIERLKRDYRLQVSATEMAFKVRDKYRLGYNFNELQGSMTDAASDVNDVLKQKSRQQEK